MCGQRRMCRHGLSSPNPELHVVALWQLLMPVHSMSRCRFECASAVLTFRNTAHSHVEKDSAFSMATNSYSLRKHQKSHRCIQRIRYVTPVVVFCGAALCGVQPMESRTTLTRFGSKTLLQKLPIQLALLKPEQSKAAAAEAERSGRSPAQPVELPDVWPGAALVPALARPGKRAS